MDEHDVARRTFEYDPVPDEYGLEGSSISRLLLCQYIGQEIERLDVTSAPPEIRNCDDVRGVRIERLRRRRQGPHRDDDGGH